MIRSGILVAALVAPLGCHAQVSGSAMPEAMPRAWQIFDQLRGYEDLTQDRFGTPSDPKPSEMGLLLVQRMFRNVCLGLERGDPLEDVMPPGFTANASGSYLFGGSDRGTGGTRVLSSTGSIARDEDEGHPAIWLRPEASGMTCAVEWTAAAEIEPDRRRGMAILLRDWLPYEMSLVRASRPSLMPEPPATDLLEWDRPCVGKWCPVTVNYMLPQGYIRLETRLDITDIGGDRP